MRPNYSDEMKDYAHTKYSEGLSFRKIAVDMTDKYGREFSHNMIAGILKRKGALGAKRPDRTGPRSAYVMKGRLRGRVRILAGKRIPVNGITIPLMDLSPDSVLIPITAGKDDRIGIMQLTSKTCRWPFGDPKKDLRYCGLQKIARSPYCGEHSKQAWKEKR